MGAAPVIYCPRCHGTMQEGYLLDRARTLEQQDWVEGKPKLGTLYPPSLDISGVAKYRVGAWRCLNCGTVELRALDRLPE